MVTGFSLSSKRDLCHVFYALHERTEAGQVRRGDAFQYARLELLDDAGDVLSGLTALGTKGHQKGPAILGIEVPAGETGRLEPIQHAGQRGRFVAEDAQQLPDRPGAVGGQVRQEVSLSPIQPQMGEPPGEVHRDLSARFVERRKNLKRHGALLRLVR